jgi:hypothetical protein
MDMPGMAGLSRFGRLRGTAGRVSRSRARTDSHRREGGELEGSGRRRGLIVPLVRLGRSVLWAAAIGLGAWFVSLLAVSVWMQARPQVDEEVLRGPAAGNLGAAPIPVKLIEGEWRARVHLPGAAARGASEELATAEPPL